VFHRVGRLLGLHEFLKGGHARDLRDQAHPIGALGIVERANRDAQRPEHFLSLPRAQPVLDIVDLVKYEMCCRDLSLLAANGVLIVCRNVA
jgi:hypothetical protein